MYSSLIVLQFLNALAYNTLGVEIIQKYLLVKLVEVIDNKLAEDLCVRKNFKTNSMRQNVA